MIGLPIQQNPPGSKKKRRQEWLRARIGPAKIADLCNTLLTLLHLHPGQSKTQLKARAGSPLVEIDIALNDLAAVGAIRSELVEVKGKQIRHYWRVER